MAGGEAYRAYLYIFLALRHCKIFFSKSFWFQILFKYTFSIALAGIGGLKPMLQCQAPFLANAMIQIGTATFQGKSK